MKQITPNTKYKLARQANKAATHDTHQHTTQKQTMTAKQPIIHFHLL